jgi:hypothetical protein
MKTMSKVMTGKMYEQMRQDWQAYKLPRRVEVGTFMVESGRLIATDPCYDDQGKKGSRTNTIPKAKNGEWSAHVYQSDTGMSRGPSTLIVKHSNFNNMKIKDWESTSFSVSVDLGGRRIIKKKFFARDSESMGALVLDESDGWSPKDHSFWYRACCQITLGKNSGLRQKGSRRDLFTSETDPKHVPAGTLAHGAVSNTLHGDGGYQCFTKKNGRGEVVAVKIVTGDNENGLF